jgi:hypothetical protein
MPAPLVFTSALITIAWATGVPMICTESSYWEEGDNNAIIDGYHYPAEWCERNHMSWFDWHRWDAADQMHTPLTYLIPDATSKGWAWWETAGTQPLVQTPIQEMFDPSMRSFQINPKGQIIDKKTYRQRNSPYRFSATLRLKNSAIDVVPFIG